MFVFSSAVLPVIRQANIKFLSKYQFTSFTSNPGTLAKLRGLKKSAKEKSSDLPYSKKPQYHSGVQEKMEIISKKGLSNVFAVKPSIDLKFKSFIIIEK